jgi:molecular chaperone DnaJ
LNREQQEHLERFAAASNEDVHPENKGFFDKVKELFG